MKNKKSIYFIKTYIIFFVYLIIAGIWYEKDLNYIVTNSLINNGYGKTILIMYGVPSLIAIVLAGLLQKRFIWEIPLMIIFNLVNIWGMTGVTAIIAAVLKSLGLYDMFISQIIIVTIMIFILNFVYGIISTRDLNNSKLMIILGGICLALILIMNIINEKYRLIHVILDVLVLIWFSYGVAQDSQQTIKDYDKINTKVESWMYSIDNASTLCLDIIFIFGQLMKLTADEKR